MIRAMLSNIEEADQYADANEDEYGYTALDVAVMFVDVLIDHLLEGHITPEAAGSMLDAVMSPQRSRSVHAKRDVSLPGPWNARNHIMRVLLDTVQLIGHQREALRER